MEKKIILGADRLAIPLKNELIKHLTKELGYEVKDVGMKDEEHFIPYYDTAASVAKAIQSGEYEKGLLFCGTGAGVSIAANKFKGIRAVLCHNAFEAKMCRVINDANIMCMGGWIVTPKLASEMVELFLSNNFKEGFPEDRHEFMDFAMGEMKKMEEENFK